MASILKRQFSCIDTEDNTSIDLLNVVVTKETIEKIQKVDFNLEANCECSVRDMKSNQ